MQHPTQQNLPQQIHSQCKIYAIVQAPTGRLYRGLDLHKPCTTIPDALFKRIVTRSLPHRRSNSCHAWVEAASTFCVPTSQSTPSSEVLLQSLKRMEIRALSAESRAFFEILDCAFTKQKLKNFSTSRVPTPRQRRTETDSNPQPHPSTQQPEHHRTRNCTSNATATSATTPISMGLRNVLERLEFIEQQTGNPTQAQQALGLLSNMIQHMNKVLDLLETKNNT
ncbi:hypothetical protein Pelo_12049 [Pelomyxa schiedti]|nr:hypothetical protein Pelo_12049 [Pelomyxa schiedti]